LYRKALQKGAHVEIDLAWDGKGLTFLEEASEAQLAYVSTQKKEAFEAFDAYLAIRAPYNLMDMQDAPAEKKRLRAAALKELNATYFRRTGTRELRRNLCQYPTQAAAQNAGISLDAYRDFVFSACKLNEPDPKQAWLDVRQRQQAVTDLLNAAEHMHYLGEGIDLQFSVKGRTWINSDGQTNMPSGEVYTSPVEDSVEGVIRFDYPAVYQGHEVEGVTLWVERGEVVKWEASRGKEFLDYIFSLDGARRFGEAAIGTNYSIDRFTRNILFDEKIGGTVHLAIGQSYEQAGGQNQSSVHWDMIAGMKRGGEIKADGETIYRNGHFTDIDL
jgi:aminopeptidase